MSVASYKILHHAAASTLLKPSVIEKEDIISAITIDTTESDRYTDRIRSEDGILCLKLMDAT